MADVDPQEGADNLEAEQRPEWLPENFSSPEDLAKSYQEAQRKITELANHNKGLEESIGELSSQFEAFTQQASQPDPYAVQNQWQEAYELDPFSTTQQLVQAETARQIQAMQEQAARQQGQVSPDVVAFMADQNLTAKYEDWGAYKAKAGEMLGNDPVFQNLDENVWRNPATATQVIERAYKMAKAEDVLSGNEIAQSIADTNRQMKLNAQSATGGAGRPDSPDAAKQRFEEIMNAPSGRLEF